MNKGQKNGKIHIEEGKRGEHVKGTLFSTFHLEMGSGKAAISHSWGILPTPKKDYLNVGTSQAGRNKTY